MSDNYICIGDIHGRNDLLTQLLENPEVFKRMDAGTHKVVFMGDMIDRGPDSYLVVAKVKDMVETGWAIALQGNHEDFALEFYRKRIPDKQSIWFYAGNGGHATVKSYADHSKQYGLGHFFKSFGQSGHAKWLRSLPLFYETDKVWLSHAPIPANGKLWPPIDSTDYRAKKELLIWTNNDDDEEGTWELDHGKLAVCGHVHALRRNILVPRVYDKIIYADTGSGCAPWGPLSAIIITDGKYEGFVQAVPLEKQMAI